jgi:hypothetical protein
MKHFRVCYDQIDNHEVWIEVSDTSEDLKDVEALFIRNFERYHDESECVDSDMIITSVCEIDENGEEI